MLSYHPALDPYHAALRIARLLARSGDGRLQAAQLRILDYYLLFPSQIAEMRLPRNLLKHRGSLAGLKNGYWLSGSPHAVLRKMFSIHSQGLALLAATGIVAMDSLSSGRVSLTADATQTPLLQLATDLNGKQSELMALLIDGIGAIPVLGKDGLKDRTGLLEHAYDAV